MATHGAALRTRKPLKRFDRNFSGRFRSDRSFGLVYAVVFPIFCVHAVPGRTFAIPRCIPVPLDLKRVRVYDYRAGQRD